MSYETQRTVVPTTFAADSSTYVDWSAIIGGIVLASAISVVMLAFGSAAGLSFSTTLASGKTASIGAGLGAALWFVWVQVSSFMAGAYLTGRLRKRKHDATAHEVEIRDGAHGVLVWAGAVLIGTYLAFAGTSSLVSVVGNAAKATTAATVAAGANTGATQYLTDALLRRSANATSSPSKDDRVLASIEINTILSRATLATPNTEDQNYLAQLVAQQTGLTAEEAKKRVDATYASMQAAKVDAANLADSARRVAIIAAFLLAASLLVSAAAAFWAATLGGLHRDEAVVFTGFFNRVRM